MEATITLGPFEVGPCIGQGGMGKVFRAVHATTGTPVAIKVIVGDGDRASQRAFHREVQAHAGLVHPGVVYLFDYGTIDEEAAKRSGGVLSAGESYVAMELADRGTVHDQMPCQDWPSVQRILLQVLDALAFAHARGVIHRDLKPENLLLFDDTDAPQPRVKLADFGLAHALEKVIERDERTLSQFSGTPYYMAPEQIRSQWRRYGPWTDLYALGCVAWHLVCGRPPYTGDSLMALAVKHCDGEFPTLEPRFSVPDGVEEWLRRAMATELTDRFQCAADAAWALPCIGGLRPTVENNSDDADTAEPQASTLHFGLLDTIDWERAKPSTGLSAISDDANKFGEFDEFDQVPPLPQSWRQPDRWRLPTALVGAGLGLFGLREVPLVDRVEERDLIWKALGEVVEQECLRVIFLSGEAGVGKSRLARWMATRAHEVGAAQVYRAIHAPGMRKAAAGMAGMIQSAFHTWKLGRRELYEELCDRLPRLKEDDDAVEIDARALTEIVYPTTDDSEVDGPRFRFGSSNQKYTLIARVLTRLGLGRPPVVWLDDLHQSPDAVGLIEYLTTSKTPPTGLILATVRSDILAEGTELSRRIAELVDGDICQRLQVDPIGASDHRELIDRMLPLGADLRDRLAERTEGNPLFAHQLLGDLIASRSIEAGPAGFEIASGVSLLVPDDIHQMWTGRIDRLVGHYPREQAQVAREAIELAAALGREVAAEEWRALCTDASFDGSDRLVDDLVERGLASRTDDGWSFAHGLLVDSIERQSAEAGRWAAHHRRCATILERIYGGQSGSSARRRANHWLAAGEDERALTPLMEAAAYHRLIGERDTAFALCDLHDEARRRLYLIDDDRRTARALLERAKLARFVGDLETTQQLLERCEATSRRNGWDALLAEVLLNQSHQADLLGDVDSGLRVGQQALALFEALDDRIGMARTLRNLGWLRRMGGDYRGAHQSFQKASDITSQLNDSVEHASSLRALSIAHKDRRQYDTSIGLALSALKIFEENDRPLLAVPCLNSLGENYRFKGDLAGAEDCYRRALATDTQAGANYDLEIYHLNLGILASMQHNYTDALKHFQRAHELVADQNQSGWIGFIHICSLVPVAGQGNWDGFDHHFAKGRENLQKWPMFNRDLAECCAEAGRLAAEAGEVTRARSVYEMARTQWTELDEPDEISAIDKRLDALDFGR